MPPEIVEPDAFSPDAREFLRLLNVHRVRFMVVGREAVIFYGHIRLTGDVDVFFDRTSANAARLFEALGAFWRNVIPGLPGPAELENPGIVFQFGVPPNRIDLLNDIDGVEFAVAWPRRTEVALGEGANQTRYAYIGLDDLIENKRASGRPKDHDDIPFLLEARQNRLMR